MMGEDSKIEWTDHTFNAWTGCTKVSPACDHCYAEAWAKRSGQVKWGAHPRKRTSETYWRQPLKWNREACASGVRRKVFCASLANVFDNQADPAWRVDLWGLIESTPHLDWLLLTKRPQNIAKMLPVDADAHGQSWEWGNGWPNVWLGTTVENQEEADRRIPHLLAVPAAKHFLSCEPLLGHLDLSAFLYWKGSTGLEWNVKKGSRWVIAGGESGPGARPPHPDWLRSLRDQCAAADVPFFFKQWGSWLPGENEALPNSDQRMAHHQNDAWGLIESSPSRYVTWDQDGQLYYGHMIGKHHRVAAWATNVGKKLAGALLDGVAHKEMP